MDNITATKTARDEITYGWIKNYIAIHHYPPTRREIAQGLGIVFSAAQYRIKRLQARGWLRLEPGRGRAMELLRNE